MNHTERYILTDIDGVCLDWESAFHEWMAGRGYEARNEKTSYWLNDVYDVPAQEIMQHVITFNESSHIAFLEPFRDSVHYMRLLNEKWGYKFVAVTALSTDPDAVKLRKFNLTSVFGNNVFHELHSIATAACKRNILTDLAQQYAGCWWIEDRDENADVGIELGYRSMLMMHPHNMFYTGSAVCVHDWQEIYQHITEEAA